MTKLLLAEIDFGRGRSAWGSPTIVLTPCHNAMAGQKRTAVAALSDLFHVPSVMYPKVKAPVGNSKYLEKLARPEGIKTSIKSLEDLIIRVMTSREAIKRLKARHDNEK